MAAMGHSIVEVKMVDGKWEIVPDSPLNRRITPETEMTISGPGAGHALMKTSADPTGTKVLRHQLQLQRRRHPLGHGAHLRGRRLRHLSAAIRQDAEREPSRALWLRRLRLLWPRPLPRPLRHDKEPNEPNRFDWVVEIDPYDPTSMPVKRTALGRMSHEASTVVLNKDGRVVVYMGDDDYFEYVYRFVSAKAYDPANPASARTFSTTACSRSPASTPTAR